MARRLRILLVRPAVDVAHKFSRPVEALGIAYLASSLRNNGHDVEIADAMLHDWSVEESLRRIDDAAADIIGFTVVLNHFPDRLLRLLSRMQERDIPGLVLVGGHAVSFFPREVLERVPRVDGVVSGEGERAICAIAGAVSRGADWRDTPGATSRRDDGSIQGKPPQRARVLEELPWPARDMTDEVIRRHGVACVSTSRGCYARCSFCSVPRFYGLDQGRRLAAGSWIQRSAEDVAAEIEALHERFSIRELLIVDDEFFGGTDAGFERARELGRMLAERDLGIAFAISSRAENIREDVLCELQAGGLAHVFIGVEAGSATSLKLYGKGHTVDQNKLASGVVKSLGLTFQAGFMLFNPRITLEQLRENIAFLKEIGEFKPIVINSSVEPHFGAPLVQLFRRDGVLHDDGMKMRVSYGDPRVRAAKAVAEGCAAAFQPFMSFISVVCSSVTFEWRRRVPGRSTDNRTLLASFEKVVNDAFAGVFEHAVDGLAAGRTPDQVLQAADEEIADVVDRMRLAQALVVARLDETEAGIRYWSARCAVDDSVVGVPV